MKIDHFAAQAQDRFNWPSILDGVKSLSDFEKSIHKHWGKYKKSLNLSIEDEDGLLREKQLEKKFLGDAFEVFAEAVLRHTGVSHSGVSEYRPLNHLNGDDDIGVDGTGIGTNGKPATVQVKFRSNHSIELFAKEDGLSGFVAASQNVYGVDVNDKYNMVVITNCSGINQRSKERMLFGKVTCLGRDQLKHIVDNVIPFWQEFRSATLPIVSNKVCKEPTSLL